MRREERVTVKGPVKEQQPDGMSHRGSTLKLGGAWGQPFALSGCDTALRHTYDPHHTCAFQPTAPQALGGWSAPLPWGFLVGHRASQLVLGIPPPLVAHMNHAIDASIASIPLPSKF